MPPDQRTALSAHTGTAAVHAVLAPEPGHGLGVKAVDGGTALILDALRQPRRLGQQAVEVFGIDAMAEVARLVLDRVLEIECDGVFLSGATAVGPLLGATCTATPSTATAKLSLAALRYAESVPLEVSSSLAWRLYRYNTLPATPELRRTLGQPEGVVGFLGLVDAPGTLEVSEPWCWWRAERERGEPRPRRRYKLYVSPRLEYVPVSFASVLRLYSARGLFDFKVGSSLNGLLRPDKLMLYFDAFEALEEVFAMLSQELTGVEAHGVPFTAPLDSDGLFSWGTDPAHDPRWRGWPRGESWRSWVTDRLATALLVARAEGEAVSAVDFALARLRLEGVDPETWAPVNGDSPTAHHRSA